MKAKARTLKTLITIFTAILLIISTTLPIFATEGVMPVLENCNTCLFIFCIVDGVATVGIEYEGDTRTFTQVMVSAKIQKRVLGVFWKTVDIGYVDNEWIEFSSQPRNYVAENFPISETGTYRAVFDVQFYGTTGVTDYLDEKVQFTYS